MASVCGDYEESWESAEPSIGQKSLITASDGQIYPRDSDDYDITRDVEPTQLQVEKHEFPVTMNADLPEGKSKRINEGYKDVGMKTKVDETAAASSCVVSEDAPTSEGTQSNVENKNGKVNALNTGSTLKSLALANDHQLLHLVRIHGHHDKHRTPPPVPVKASVVSKDRYDTNPSSKPDFGALRARVAAKRIAEFRRRQASNAEKERELESAWAQKRREIRRSNEAMHKALGVAGLSAQDHLQIAHRRLKQEAKEKKMAVSLERQNRWYNCISKWPISAPDHVRELNLQHRRATRESERSIKLKRKSIQANQLDVRQKAQEIIATASGAYIRGSYLLKVTHHMIKKPDQPLNDQEDVNADKEHVQ